MPVCLTIAGSDPSGGAGILADLRTFQEFWIHGAAAISLVTFQNSLGVHGVEVLPGPWVASQAHAVLDDLPVACVKTGALGNAEVVSAVSRVLVGRGLPVVVDPVMASKAGRPLLAPEAIRAMWDELFPLAHLLTPNLDEASLLLEGTITTVAQMREASRELRDRSGAQAVLVKGGHLEGNLLVDVLCDAEGLREWTFPRVDTPHSRGTGCTFASAIAAGIAQGKPLRQAVDQARSWLQIALETSFPLGAGRGRLGPGRFPGEPSRGGGDSMERAPR
ncbi:MAG TPA: bifunctional hydroxymethylpyrimidine kinase/phosphomethylpyrimidine kinase [Fibrobacteria bacterium]|nr:bifunctional hydroxymethylpyrimidine kinase/phosphomethylpyrimidine kinase [Fibrobacteria bacterium]HOX50207.1 bifunctional hydroxymethylpyrimidine kinase/phosphomethylpyrimidine kinase [Fibrobacteria bacterium]